MKKKINPIFYIFILALLLRLIVLFILNYCISPQLQYRLTPPDARGYDIAVNIMRAWKEKRPVYGEVFERGTFSYYQFIVAAIFYIAGIRPILPPLLNTLFGAFAVFFIYDLAKRLFTRKIAAVSSFLYAVFPSLIFWSTQNLKDTMCIFIVIFVIWVSIRLLKEPFRMSQIVLIAVATPLLFVLNELRNYIFVFTIYAVIFSFLVNLSQKTLKKNIIYMLYFYLVMCVFPQYLQLNLLSRIPRYFFIHCLKREAIDLSMKDTTKILLGEIKEHNRGGAFGNAAIPRNVKFTSYIDVVKYLPTGIIYFLFAPFPWYAKGLLQIATIPEMLVWYMLFPFILYGMYIYRDRWKMNFAIIFFIGITLLAYSLYEGNFGTGYRHRAILLPFFFIFASAGLVYQLESVKQKRDSSTRLHNIHK